MVSKSVRIVLSVFVVIGISYTLRSATSHEQETERAKHIAETQKQLKDAQAKEVRVIPASSCSSLGLEDIGKALIPIDREASQGKEPATIKLIAWCSKGLDYLPPSNLREEVIVAVSWRPGEAEILYYLCDHWRQGRRDWESPGQLIESMTQGNQFKAKTSGKYTEEDVIKFVRTTNFGNNNFLDHDLVLSIILYEPKMNRLYQELLAGIDLDARFERHEEHMTAVMLQGSWGWEDGGGQAKPTTPSSGKPAGTK